MRVQQRPNKIPLPPDLVHSNDVVRQSWKDLNNDLLPDTLFMRAKLEEEVTVRTVRARQAIVAQPEVRNTHGVVTQIAVAAEPAVVHKPRQNNVRVWNTRTLSEKV